MPSITMVISALTVTTPLPSVSMDLSLTKDRFGKVVVVVLFAAVNLGHLESTLLLSTERILVKHSIKGYVNAAKCCPTLLLIGGIHLPRQTTDYLLLSYCKKKKT